MLQSPIKPDDARADLIREASVIIWDEAPMVNRAVFACVDETCRMIMRNDLPFGGKILILLGDFRQTCPVIRRGTRAQVVDASIRSSPQFQLFTIYRLTTPIRNASDLAFAAFVDDIGDGAGPSVSLSLVASVPSMSDLIHFVYPPNVINDPVACLKRALLAPTHRQVNTYNDIIIASISGESRTYLAADSLKEVDDVGLIPPDSVLDYIARHTPDGFPHHALTLKIDVVVRLLRNLSVDRGLVKNVRMVITGLGRSIVTVRVLRGIGGVSIVESEDVLIPRITFMSSLPSGHTLIRRQFPLAPAYATTFNSCQGLTLDTVGLDVTRPVFSHGQLYTALSRIRNRTNARVLLRPGETTTPNVTYKEILL
jgi:hypothetical protein